MTVSLVGAGPGDPGLITAKGLELIRNCEALVYDVLVSPELVDEAPEDALKISREGVKQAELNELLVDLGKRGLETVRLKGGDPFVFGRGGEEALALVAAGIDVQVIPGVSSISAVPASAGIPITHRGVSAQVTIVSGHLASGEDIDFAQLAGTPGTLVVFMGLTQLARTAEKLIEYGRDARTPAAVVSQGTLPGQATVTGELHEVGGLAREQGLVSPALLVVGDVVAVGGYLANLARQSLPASR